MSGWDPTDPDRWSPYAPVRWRNMMFWSFAKDAAKHGMVTANGRISSELPELIMRALVVPVMREIDEQVKRGELSKDIVGQAMSKHMEQRHWVPLNAQYELNGRQIFDLHDVLAEMLLNTDVSECTLEDIKLPYDCFYIRFGKQEEIKVPFDDDFEYVDGAFVGCTPWSDDDGAVGPKRLKVGLTTVKKDGGGVMMPGYFLDFTPDELKLKYGEAVDAALGRRIAAFHEGTEPGTNAGNLAFVRSEEAKEGALLARKALPLIFNTLFYLESLSEIPAQSVGRDTTPELTAKWEQSKPNGRYKVASELTANGFTVVRLVGKEVADSVVNLGWRGEVRTHWRRGYMRNQVHGPQRSLRKRIWIKPTVVRADRDDASDQPGHIYVSGTNSSH